MRCYKKAIFRTAIIGTLAMVSLAMGLVAEASAGCPNLPGFKAGAFQPISWQRMGEFGPGSPLLVADRDDFVDRIVGFWRVTWVSKGNPGVPDGTVLGDGFQQWHSDGTEIHYAAETRPAGGNFCLGSMEEDRKVSIYTQPLFPGLGSHQQQPAGPGSNP